MEEDDIDIEDQEASCTPAPVTRKEVKCGNIGVAVIRGDITKERVDIIVNSVVKGLDLSKGRASSAVLNKAGSEIQNECNSKYPNGIEHGEIAVTGPGKLSCKKIYHGSIPKYSGPADEQVLKDLVQLCLVEASKYRQRSLAFPAFGTGFLEYPLQTVSKIMFDGIDNFSNRNPSSSLKHIDIVVYHGDKETYKTFRSLARKRAISCQQPVSQVPTSTSTMKTRHSCRLGKITVELLEGSLADTKADILVCSGPKDLHLNNGGLSQSLLEVAGDDLQNECDNNFPNGIDFGEMAVTKGYELQCQFIYHGAIPEWGNTHTDPLQTLKDFVSLCLEEANKHPTNTRSIAFPTIGTGSLKFPAADAAKAMVETLRIFEQRKSKTKLQHIFIIFFNGDKNKEDLLSAYKKELTNIGHHGQRGQNPMNRTIRQDICSSVYGSVAVTVASGNMNDESADIIVCCTSPDLQLKNTPGVCAALYAVVGDNLQTELDNNYSNGINVGEIAEAGGHGLKCKKLYIGTLLSWYSKKKVMSPEDALSKFVTECLTKANGDGHQSLALPALGTGYMKFPADVVAGIIVKSIQDFATTTKQPHLQKIRVVLYSKSSDFDTIEKAFKDELTGHTAAIPQPQLPNTGCKIPKRGTKEYFKYKYTERLYSPSYWTGFSSKHSLKTWNLQSKKIPFKLEKLDQKTYQSVESAFLTTFGLKHPQIISIERIENTELFMKYAEERQRLFRKAAVEGEFLKLDKVKGSSGMAKTISSLDSSITQHLHPEINEYYFFHGTKPAVVEAIKHQGLDPRVANSVGRVGNGVYGAECSAKSNQYVGQYASGEHPMFLMRMCLGDIYITANQQSFSRPPCRICHNEVCLTHPELFDSVVADGGVFGDREFVVYDINQTYPEFLILYK